MQDFFDAIVFGLREIFKTKVMKFAILSGMVVSTFWVLFGVLFFDSIVNLSGDILALIPFSMIRSNGAWMLSTFLWLQLVLVTFALVFAFIGSFLANKNKTNKFASSAIYIALSSAIFWSVVWSFSGDLIYTKFLQLFTWLPFEAVQESLSYLIGFYFLYTGVIISLIFVASAFSIKFLKDIKAKNFPYDRMYEEHEYKNIKQTFKDTTLFIVASAVSFPLLFIPILNFIILVILWVWLMKDTLSYDVCAFVFGEIDKEKLKEYKKGLWAITFLGSLFNFIPILNTFAPYFTQLSMFYYLKEKRDIIES